MSMHIHLRILRIYFLRYQENSHPENLHQSNFPLVNPPWKIHTWNIPTYVLKDSRPCFLIFFHHCYRYHWYYLKDCLVILCSMFQKWLGLHVCENLSKGSVKWRKTINEMKGDILERIFWVAIFRREVFQREFHFFGWGFFGQEFPWEEFSLNHFFSYNVSILTF